MDENIIIADNAADNIDYLNKVSLTGSVIHKYRPQENVIILTLAVKGQKHEVDYPNVVFYGDKAATIDEVIVVKEKDYPRVHIEGYVRTTRKETDDGVRYYQNLVGTNLSRTLTNMELISGKRGVGSRKAPSENQICLLGSITHIYPLTREGQDRPFGAIVTMAVQNNGRVNYPRVTCFDAAVGKVLGMKAGDVICVTAFAETTTRDKDGRRVRFESIIAEEVDKIQ